MIEDWQNLPKYPVLPDRPQITNYKQLPDGVRLLGKIDGVRLLGQLPSYNEHESKDNLMFCENHGGLSIIGHHTSDSDLKPYCQWDFPMALLTWLPEIITRYSFPPGKGDNATNTTPDMIVGDEILALRRCSGGFDRVWGGRVDPTYDVINWSRRHFGNYVGSMTVTICWTDAYLFDKGGLDFIQDLGKKWQNGTL